MFAPTARISPFMHTADNDVKTICKHTAAASSLKQAATNLLLQTGVARRSNQQQAKTISQYPSLRCQLEINVSSTIDN